MNDVRDLLYHYEKTGLLPKTEIYYQRAKEEVIRHLAGEASFLQVQVSIRDNREEELFKKFYEDFKCKLANYENLEKENEKLRETIAKYKEKVRSLEWKLTTKK